MHGSGGGVGLLADVGEVASEQVTGAASRSRMPKSHLQLEAGLKLVVDVAGGSGELVLTSIIGWVDLEALTVNAGLHESRPTETREERRAGLVRLGELVASACARNVHGPDCRRALPHVAHGAD
ncbi:hypothetical protein BIV57_08455 [Mangrovactinospora gilvigrisea]|uniref:Uncharacterized protein n=1 Tax=Mangrovactinospora gilvigrisea TaxID=1428644 RepID=A0A1J7CDY8_9ACTN|nr:hypothetical protein [Mangrovactinospora gilvigrisea]OIV37882.1 hypothetical protein BIV57_08455 [Mangrovactinospora gilvigrisea]